ncbi:MAG: hypothetical protein CMJ83_18850 [Planctomycetes bacterium]|nr:hypothetical protein [Planctomycetota bacterium]
MTDRDERIAPGGMEDGRPAPHGWSVWRQDDHGNRFEVVRGQSRVAAEEEARRFESLGHKQTYWTAPTEA